MLPEPIRQYAWQERLASWENEGEWMKNRYTIFKLFISYIFLVIPMLLVNFLLTNSMENAMRRDLNQRIEQGIAQIEQELNNQSITYRSNAIKLSVMDQLSPDKLNGRGATVIQGIELLENIRMMDDFMDDILLCYRNELYTSSGYVQPENYFREGLNCAEEAVQFGCDILQEEKEAMVYLPTESGGHLLYHYPLKQGYRKTGGVESINYSIDMEKLYALLMPMMEQVNLCIQISMDNEWQKEQIYLNREDENQFHVIDETRYLQTLEEGRWVDGEIHVVNWNMKLCVSYNSNQIYEQVTFWQYVNVVVMGILLLFAVGTTYLISRRQYEKIYRLRQSLQRIGKTEESTVPQKRQDEFDYMHTMIQSIVRETDYMRLETVNTKKLLQQHGAMLLFYSNIREEEVMHRMMESSGVILPDSFYSVVCVVSTENRSGSRLPDSLVQDRISCIVDADGRIMEILLLELENEDYTKEKRRQFAQEIYRMQGSSVKVAFSKVYRNILRASVACMEANVVLERLLQTDGEYAEYADNWMDSKQQMVQFPEESLIRMENAVTDGQKTKAVKELDLLLDFIRKTPLTQENQKYLRYSILQSIMFCAQKKEKKNTRALFADFAYLDLNDRERFDEKLKYVLKQCCAGEEAEEKDKKEFDKILQYIENNYQRYDLSLDEVAQFAGLSKAYMSRLFKEKIGSKYIEYLTACRMEQAKKLLLETDMTVQQIAETVGYHDIPGFRKKFKGYFGINAAELREEYRAEKEKNGDPKGEE